MSKLSIYENGWLNLVFERKNKAYGAYQLRRENPRTTLFAFLLGLLFIASASGIGFLLSSFASAPATEIISDGPTIVPIDLDLTVIPEPPKPPAAKQPAAPLAADDKKPLINPEIVKPELADDVKRNDDLPAAPTTMPGEGTATPDTNTSGTATGTIPTTAKPEVTDNNPVILAALDKLPEFPGGMPKFYAYVANNFEKPEIDETVNVLLSFVIEKDGSITDIKVLRNPGYGLDKEAIRVLKSLKTKWKPGMKNGQAVRTLYTLPIKVTRN